MTYNLQSTVLNLAKEATPAEVHERHRALSLAFHPDKQEGDELKEIGTKHFLQIQKAYQGQGYLCEPGGS